MLIDPVEIYSLPLPSLFLLVFFVMRCTKKRSSLRLPYLFLVLTIGLKTEMVIKEHFSAQLAPSFMVPISVSCLSSYTKIPIRGRIRRYELEVTRKGDRGAMHGRGSNVWKGIERAMYGRGRRKQLAMCLTVDSQLDFFFFLFSPSLV